MLLLDGNYRLIADGNGVRRIRMDEIIVKLEDKMLYGYVLDNYIKDYFYYNKDNLLIYKLLFENNLYIKKFFLLNKYDLYIDIINIIFSNNDILENIYIILFLFKKYNIKDDQFRALLLSNIILLMYINIIISYLLQENNILWIIKNKYSNNSEILNKSVEYIIMELFKNKYNIGLDHVFYAVEYIIDKLYIDCNDIEQINKIESKEMLRSILFLQILK